MLGYSMLKVIRRHNSKLDNELRHKLIHMYRPLKWIPCILHQKIEKWVKKLRKLPVIIEFESTQGITSVLNSVHQVIQNHMRCEIKAYFKSISSCACKLSPQAIEELLEHNTAIKKIYIDRKVNTLLDKVIPSVHAHELHQSELTGKDVTIAVIDTGVYPHADFTQPNNRLIAFKDFVHHRQKPYDDNGHGTHCTGDAAGNGFLSKGKYRAPAYEANIIGVKVLDHMGSGLLSTVLQGVEWCINHREQYNIKIISMSLGSSAQLSAADDPLVKIVEKAWDNGIVVCAAAGNEGPGPRTIASPGISPKIITVGAMNQHRTTDREDDQVADFSSRGPTIDGISKPDLLAPGVHIVSTNAPDSFLEKMQKKNRVGHGYLALSGTSMATPVCAGVIAQLLQVNPYLTPDEVKFHLLQGAEDRGLAPDVQGRGYLDAKKSLASALTN